jgi:hypothetical protein
MARARVYAMTPCRPNDDGGSGHDIQAWIDSDDGRADGATVWTSIRSAPSPDHRSSASTQRRAVQVVLPRFVSGSCAGCQHRQGAELGVELESCG